METENTYPGYTSTSLGILVELFGENVGNFLLYVKHARGTIDGEQMRDLRDSCLTLMSKQFIHINIVELMGGSLLHVSLETRKEFLFFSSWFVNYLVLHPVLNACMALAMDDIHENAHF